VPIAGLLGVEEEKTLKRKKMEGILNWKHQLRWGGKTRSGNDGEKIETTSVKKGLKEREGEKER